MAIDAAQISFMEMYQGEDMKTVIEKLERPSLKSPE
jgi:hypothetical protein